MAKRSIWERIALSKSAPKCARCHGLGLAGRGGGEPCECVLRAVFRSCEGRYHSIAETQASGRTMARRCFIGGSGGRERLVFGRNAEEFRADFFLSAKRALDAGEWALFAAYCLRGASRGLCEARLGLNKGQFYHALYRVQAKVGRALVERGVWGGGRGRMACAVAVDALSSNRCALVVPLREAA